ncbi:MAG TPA: ATP-dependent protease LonB [Firmicutes bacterium]|nr:ATP-dependent protease LonB [Bacillota bacterium]
MDFGSAIALLQVFFAIVIGLYFLNLLRTQQSNKVAIERESRKELDKLKRLRQISLTEPLSEKTRPASFSDIIGQEDGLRALRAALCGANPQHVIIYGPPGVGKTAAARIVLEEAKLQPNSPFGPEAKFVEVDATTARFDERGIADPIIGSVHDPIYQGAGAMGVAGIPQPKPGAVTKAHGGILFIDEIGELHTVQMNKLLKVLEDRKVFLESAYYSSEDSNIPQHIHDIFQKGLPADFRLVGATTRLPEEISPAIRSRCMEIFFRPLLAHEIGQIAQNAARKIGITLPEAAEAVIRKYASNGREAVNILQIAAGLAAEAGRHYVAVEDAEWVVNSSQYSPRYDQKIPLEPQVGFANGLAVVGPSIGALLEIEVTAIPTPNKDGRIIVTGIADEEEIGDSRHVIRRQSMAKESVQNVLTALRHVLDFSRDDYDIHVNFPGGRPVDGPSAGVSMAVAIYSALTKIPVDNKVAMTGEISIRGMIKPVGGTVAKIQAAIQAGASRVLVPKENYQEIFRKFPIEVVPICTLEEALQHALLHKERAVS